MNSIADMGIRVNLTFRQLGNETNRISNGFQKNTECKES